MTNLQKAKEEQIKAFDDDFGVSVWFFGQQGYHERMAIRAFLESSMDRIAEVAKIEGFKKGLNTPRESQQKEKKL